MAAGSPVLEDPDRPSTRRLAGPGAQRPRSSPLAAGERAPSSAVVCAEAQTRSTGLAHRRTGRRDGGCELSRIARSGDWRFVHSVPVGTRGSGIDHVLVGPGGVFTINTKAHRDAHIWVGPNTIMVSGHKQPYLRNSRHEASRASKLLSAATGFEVRAHPVIAMVDPRNITYRNPPADVTVVTRRGLKRWVWNLPPILDDHQVEAIFSAVRRSTTWT